MDFFLAEDLLSVFLFWIFGKLSGSRFIKLGGRFQERITDGIVYAVFSLDIALQLQRLRLWSFMQDNEWNKMEHHVREITFWLHKSNENIDCIVIT